MKITRDMFSDGFTAMPITSIDQVKDCHMATAGVMFPSEIAQRFGGFARYSVGAIMAYGFRRFGYPVNGWDSGKEVCRWIVTTPMDGVFVTISPTSVAPFGYAVAAGLYRDLVREQTAPYRAWGQQCRAWAKATYGLTMVNSMAWGGHCTEDELEAASEAWLRATYPEAEGAESVEQIAERAGVSVHEITHRFWADQQKEYDRIASEFTRLCPYPDMSDSLALIETTTVTPFYDVFPDGSLERQVNAALYRAILDMHRPVSVRDWELTFDGEPVDSDSEEDEDMSDMFAPVSRMAGYGLQWAVERL